MLVVIKENSCIAKLAAKRLKSSNMAITIGRTIYLYNATKQELLSQPHWLRHEVEHVLQYQQYGIPGFLLRYVWESLRRGYYNNKYEVAAREAEQDVVLPSHIIIQ
jgi:hypothetical protein